MVKVALCRFQESLGPFAMFVAEETSITGFYRHLSNHLFRSGNLGNASSMRGIFFWKSAKFNVAFKNAEKRSEKVFGF